MSPLLDELGALDSRLGSGLQFERYTNSVADARVPYDALIADLTAAEDEQYESLGGIACVSEVAIPLERALERFTEAGDLWNECVTDIDCDFERDTLPDLQDQWERASIRIDDARAGLADLGAGQS